MSDNKITLDDITDKYIRPLNSEQEEKLIDMFFKNNISHELFDSPKGEVYKVSFKVYEYLIQEEIGLELVEVKNIGSLSLEERNRIKKYNHKGQRERSEKAIKELREKYGSL